MADRPTEAQVKEFLDGLRSYRATIPEQQQKMLDHMVLGAVKQRQSAEEQAEVTAYWSAYNPPGAAGGYGVYNPVGPGAGVGVPGGVGW